MLELTPERPDIMGALFSSANSMAAQGQLIHAYNHPDAPIDAATRLWALDFPEDYLGKLSRLVHSDWHTACFAATPTNAAMWGNYGDGHKGVCLEFRTSPNVIGQPSIDLYRMNGFGSGGPLYGWVSHAFQPVTYSNSRPRIDFFRSMGSLSRYKLTDFWYRGDDGTMSDCAVDILQESEAWRQQYWSDFHQGTTAKTLDWAHEQEQRLTLGGGMMAFDEPHERKLKYRFSDLSGIAFGIKTPESHKRDIMQIIAAKCEAEKRSDFRFYQVQASQENYDLKLWPLSLLKVQP